LKRHHSALDLTNTAEDNERKFSQPKKKYRRLLHPDGLKDFSIELSIQEIIKNERPDLKKLKDTRNFWKLHVIELEDAAVKAIEDREDLWSKTEELDEDISQKKAKIRVYLSIVERALVV